MTSTTESTSSFETFSNSYQLTRWVAQQLPRHPGATSRDLYQHYLPRFAEFGTDGGSGSAMIGQHLKKLEAEGLVVSDKPRNGKPNHWTWVGPAAAALVTADPAASETDPSVLQVPESPPAEPEPDTWQPDILAPYDSATDTPTAEESTAVDSDLRRTEADPLQQAIALLQVVAQARRVPDTLTADLKAILDTIDEASDALYRATTALSKIICGLLE